ncbi:TetR/AcrR family transcriptional regulator [Sphingobacterium olei]|uniref:TetR/AcrR family transcriptional regulator n=1 Tax=Sphingobacterium olei TaxID=2571155 RepID=A0A4U0NTY1_9SPHI|nr:TetR/AcrR family transcriptional regulator [Sphingobacterium olei]TJZ53704.1 TetR/AcrR family transcriptional regulator [Sphingobacterium olei]
MKTEQSHIVETAGWLCAQFGLKSTTMDDIAHHSGVSKKTLYLYFENKKTLIKKIVQNLLDHDEQYLRASIGISPNETIEMVIFFYFMCKIKKV